MSQDPTGAYVKAAADFAELVLSEESLSATTANTLLLRAMQAKFMDLDLADDLDPAPMLRL